MNAWLTKVEDDFLASDLAQRTFAKLLPAQKPVVEMMVRCAVIEGAQQQLTKVQEEMAKRKL